ncbi:hypothetical protein PSEUDO8Z_190133 [Pseudomonas sp. 8Z]|nr:hypothetical protein PSEUDO8Z_190133 [Pseudomonas sp. 8Z]
MALQACAVAVVFCFPQLTTWLRVPSAGDEPALLAVAAER